MDQGIMRYKLPETDFAVLPGKYGYMIQVMNILYSKYSVIYCTGES